MSIVPAIDVHGRYGMKTQIGITGLRRRFVSAAAKPVCALARYAWFEWTISWLLLGAFLCDSSPKLFGGKF